MQKNDLVLLNNLKSLKNSYPEFSFSPLQVRQLETILSNHAKETGSNLSVAESNMFKKDIRGNAGPFRTFLHKIFQPLLLG